MYILTSQRSGAMTLLLMLLFLCICESRGQSQKDAQASLLIGLITVIAESSAGPERDACTAVIRL